MIHFIQSWHGLTLWQKGDYLYELENRNTGEKKEINGGIEVAKNQFNSIKDGLSKDLGFKR